jgi:hypothetical protein
VIQDHSKLGIHGTSGSTSLPKRRRMEGLPIRSLVFTPLPTTATNPPSGRCDGRCRLLPTLTWPHAAIATCRFRKGLCNGSLLTVRAMAAMWRRSMEHAKSQTNQTQGSTDNQQSERISKNMIQSVITHAIDPPAIAFVPCPYASCVGAVRTLLTPSVKSFPPGRAGEAPNQRPRCKFEGLLHSDEEFQVE